MLQGLISKFSTKLGRARLLFSARNFFLLVYLEKEILGFLFYKSCRGIYDICRYVLQKPRPKTLTISRRLKYLTEKEQNSANKRTRSVNSVREIIQGMYV